MRVAIGLLFVAETLYAQDSVDVTFRYSPPTAQSLVYLVGEFNGWNNQAWPMTPMGNNTFIKTARLALGGAPGGRVTGAYQYKFYYPGLSSWPNDPLNHHSNPSDNNNSVLYVRDPTIYQFVPNERTGDVRASNPEISAYIFPKVGSTIDTSTIALTVGEKTYRGLGASYDLSTRQLRFRIPDALRNGVYPVMLRAGATADSTSVRIQAGFVQITSLGDFTTRKAVRTIYGVVEDTSIHQVRITRNTLDTITASVSAGQFSAVVPLAEGKNSLQALVRDSEGSTRVSEAVAFTYLAPHAPDADIYLISAGPNIILSAQGSSDPDSGQSARLKYFWMADANNPQIIAGVSGASTSQVIVAAPSAPGDYFFTLVAEDPDGNRDTTRNYFSVLPDRSVERSTIASSPRWARQGRLYEMFFKSMTPQGTINAALPYLPYLKSLGVNILWVMPVMENAAPINNRSGPGYNIKNLFKVAPEYGTNEDFKNFVKQAHALGLKVILDVTPNHTSYLHPFVVEARQYGRNSPHWDFYQHANIPHNTNGLGQSLTSDGFVYYSGFSDQLLNYNWSDVDARAFMIEVYKWWVKEFDIDGYRFDVYWGPHRRAGGGAGNELEMGIPVRRALKKIKPDIFLLAEDDGTGSGTEVIFADRNGGVDAGYDWVLYGGAIRTFAFDAASIENLHARFYNNNFYPGQNALFLRFMENHDEERIVTVYGEYSKTMPVATTVFTTPGLPMIYSGQEVGFGLGLTDYDNRRRGVINWNAAGKSLLLPHYQRLATIRSQYGALWSQKLTRLTSGNGNVYAYVRPASSGDALVAVNFSSTPQSVQLALGSQVFESATVDGKPYYFNDVYNDTSYLLSFQNGQATFTATLRPYGSLICIKSDSLMRFAVPPLVFVEREGGVGTPTAFALSQNYPNPFNPSTTIRYVLPFDSFIRLEICDVLGRVITTLANQRQESGTYAVQWNAGSNPSGIYFCRLAAEPTSSGKGARTVSTIKMLLLK
jgi:glycosidase